MKLEARIILKLFLNFSDFEPQYSYKLHSYKKERRFYYTEFNTDSINYTDSCIMHSIFWYSSDLRPDVKRKKRMQAIKRSTIFEKQVDSKEQLAMHLAGLATRRNSTNVKRMPNSFEKTFTNVVIGRKGDAMKERTPATHVNDSNKNKDSVEAHVRLDATESFGEQSKKGEPGHSNITKSFDLANDTIAENSNIIEDQEEVKGPTISDGQCLALGQFVMKDGNSQEAEGSNNEITSASEIPFQLSYNKAKLNSSLVAEYGTSSDDE